MKFVCKGNAFYGFLQSLFCKDIHKLLALPAKEVQAHLKKKKSGEGSVFWFNGWRINKEIEEEPGPDWFCKPGSSPCLRPPFLMTTSYLSSPCVQCMDSKMSKPEPLLPMTLFSRKCARQIQTDILLIRHSATYKWYSGALCKLPRLYFIAFKCRVSTGREQRITLSLCSFVAYFFWSIQLREEISLRG